jgi:hypothetical protein
MRLGARAHSKYSAAPCWLVKLPWLSTCVRHVLTQELLVVPQVGSDS